MKKLLLSAPFLLFALLLLLRPAEALSAAQEGLLLCFRSIIPSLFPMMVVTGLLLRLGAADCLQRVLSPLMGPLFQLRGACAAPLLMGLVGGYPVGADSVAQLYRQGLCTKGEAERLLSFCNNCGPAFLLSYVGGGLFGSTLLGCKLFLLHALSALAVGALLCRRGRREPLPLPGRPLPQKAVSLPLAFTRSVTAALQSVLQICAFVTLFAVAAALLPESAPPFAVGLLEMTSGLSGLPDTRAGHAMAAALVGFGGLSVHCQTLAVLADTDIAPRLHFPGKVLQAALSAALAYSFL